MGLLARTWMGNYLLEHELPTNGFHTTDKNWLPCSQKSLTARSFSAKGGASWSPPSILDFWPWTGRPTGVSPGVQGQKTASHGTPSLLLATAFFHPLFSIEPILSLSILCQFQIRLTHSAHTNLSTSSCLAIYQCRQPLTLHPTPSSHSTSKSLFWFSVVSALWLTRSNLGHSHVLGCRTAHWSRTYSLRTKTASPQKSSTGRGPGSTSPISFLKFI